MTYPHLRALTVFAALTLATIAACVTQGSGPPTTGATGQDALSETLTVPGRPSDRVTDIAGFELTAEEAEEFEHRCREGAGVPGRAEICLVPRVFKGGRSPCPVGRPVVCVIVSHVRDDPTAAVAKMVDYRPGSPACSDDKVTLCRGIVVDAEVVAPLIGPPTTKPTTKNSSPPAGTSKHLGSVTTKPTPPPVKTTPPPVKTTPPPTRPSRT